MSENETEVSVVLPCLNEAESLEHCISMAKLAFENGGLVGEIIVADNGSTDGSQEIAASLGAKVVHIEEKGYGNALMGGIRAAQGRYCVMGDADGSYDFSQIPDFICKLREGFDLVMGNRFLGGVKKGAMPFLHRYVGNPVLSGLGRLFFRCKCRDLHCGLRAFKREAILALDLKTTGMEFASEMIIKAALTKLKITEIPTTLSPDLRSGPPHLRTWRDGWRHLRFLLLFSPRWLFLYPGIFTVIGAGLLAACLFFRPITIGGVTFDVNTFVFVCLAGLIGFQSIAFALFARTFAMEQGILPYDQKLRRVIDYFSLEKGVVLGALLVAAGGLGTVYAVSQWSGQELSPDRLPQMMRLVILSAMTIAAGVQATLFSFFMSILKLNLR